MTKIVLALVLAIIIHFPQSEWNTANCVAWYESRFNPSAEGQAGERGIFQIHPVHFDRFDPAGLWDVGSNVEAASMIWEDSGWAPWTTMSLCERR